MYFYNKVVTVYVRRVLLAWSFFFPLFWTWGSHCWFICVLSAIGVYQVSPAEGAPATAASSQAEEEEEVGSSLSCLFPSILSSSCARIGMDLSPGDPQAASPPPSLDWAGIGAAPQVSVEPCTELPSACDREQRESRGSSWRRRRRSGFSGC